MGDSLVKHHFLLRECYKAPCWTRKKIHYVTLRRRTIFTRKTARGNIKG